MGCEISEGEILDVTFNVGDETVTVVGVVAWATEIDALTLDVGLEFVEVDPLVVRLLHEGLEAGPDR